MREALVESCRCYQNRVNEDPIFDAVGPHTKATHDPIVILSRLIEFMCDIGSAAATNLTSLDETPVALMYTASGLWPNLDRPTPQKRSNRWIEQEERRTLSIVEFIADGRRKFNLNIFMVRLRNQHMPR